MRTRSLALVLALSAFAASASDAAVLCQKGKALKLRADACKPKETPVATVGDGGLAGIWERTGGTLQTFSGAEARYLTLGPDGSGELTASGGDGPVLSCVSLNYARNTNQTIVLDDWEQLVGTRVYRMAQDGDTLELTDPVGATAQFARASAVDPEADCESLVEAGRFTGLPDPDSSSGLVFDGTDLWYTEENDQHLVSVNPETGATGTTLPLTYTYVHAAQGADFWAHCNCGGSEEALRVTRAGTTVDTVQTNEELGEEISVEAIAYQGGADALWLHGWNDANEGRLMKVAASGEPDALVEAFDLDADIGGMTFAGNELWALNEYAQTVMRIDVATGHVTGTFSLPDRTAWWHAIAAIGDQLFVLGEGNTQGGAALRSSRARGAQLAGEGGRGVILVVQKPS